MEHLSKGYWNKRELRKHVRENGGYLSVLTELPNGYTWSEVGGAAMIFVFGYLFLIGMYAIVGV